ncbi:MAG TPA: outer membrane lipoprotein-sorting protein [Candidatus Angelobacter sp.]|nr:outer membrane lipoprotein-sorting protein [Candidatus Angelobacter sp.]
MRTKVKAGFMQRVPILLIMLVSFCSFAQKNDPPQPANAEGDLDAVLSKMDKAAQNFKSVQADFEWDQYTKVVNDTDVQKGQLYLQRHQNNVEAGVNITSPTSKQIVFKDGKVRMYEPKIDQITEREVGANKADVESFLRLGFGERGHDLLKSYEVKLDGWETVDGVKTAKLELVGNSSSSIRNMFSKIVWWIDPERDVSLRQQLFQPNGDYRLAHYSDIKLNAKPSQDFFHLHTTSKTKVVTMKP